MKRRELLTALPLLGLAQLPIARAQSYPVKPVRIMVGASPGGGTDILARLLGEKFGAHLKQTFLVENRPGASNTIAADATAKADKDGHTLLVATTTGQAIAPHLIKLGYDPLKEIQPIGMVAVVPNVLVVGPSQKAANLAELLAEIRKNPGSFNYASSGVGSTQHIAGEAFNQAAGVKTTHVPYKGSSAAHIDLISGNVQMMFDTTSSAMPQIKGGKLRPLAVTTTKRSEQLPDVPTMAEAGTPMDMTTWYGLFVTAGTPKPAVDALIGALRAALASTDVQERIKGLAGEVGNLYGDDLAQFNRKEFERYGELIRSAKIQAS